MHQYAYTGTGKTIHSATQLEWYMDDGDECSRRISNLLHPGEQCIKTMDGYLIPLSSQDSLAYMKNHPPTDEEF